MIVFRHAGIGVFLAAFSLTGCLSKPLVIELPPTFVGHVEIECGGSTPNGPSIRVGSTGHATMSACPKHDSPLVFIRNGQEIKPDGSVELQTTGDGLVVDIQLSVR